MPDLVGGHQGEIVAGHRNGIAAGEAGEGLDGSEGGKALPRGPQVVDELDLEADDGAVLLERQRRFVAAIPGLAAAGGEVLGTVFDPLDRTSAGLAREQRGDVRAAEAHLAAEAPAAGVADETHLVGGDPQDRSATQGQQRRGLEGAATGHTLLHRVPLADDPEVLNGVGADAIPAEALREDVVRRLEGLIHLPPPEDPLQHDVRAALFVDERASRLHGLDGVDHGLQGLVVHVDELEGILGHVAAGGRHGRYRLSHVARLVRRHAVGAPALRHGGAREAPAEGVFRRDDGRHARQLLGLARVDAFDARMGEGAAQNRAVQHAG